MAKNVASEKKHVIISGVSRGLGLETARELLVQGYNVSGFSRKTSADVSQLQANSGGNKFYFAEVDITSSDDLAAFMAGAVESNGIPHALINNAAVAQEGILATLPEIEISRMMQINLEGALRLTRLCLRHILTSGKGGRIINISSVVGSRGYNGLAIYSATKAALDGLTRSLARELGKRKITVNSVAPGYMKTAMSAGLSEENLSQIVRRTPLGRLAEIGDIIPLIIFLLSDQAAFITGQTLIVDGGISA